MNPAFLLGTAFNIAYWHRKYHSGTICKGVSNPQSSKALSVCEKEEIPKWVWTRYRQRIRMKPKKSFWKMKGKNGILLFVEFLKGLVEGWRQEFLWTGAHRSIFIIDSPLVKHWLEMKLFGN